MQTTNHIFLVRPANFGFNRETASSNFFQKEALGNNDDIHQKALAEFDAFTKTLKDNGITVTVFKDTQSPTNPDAIFPNNWISTHPDETLVLYPMLTPNRRTEVNWDFIVSLAIEHNLTRINDLRYYTRTNKFLEGTGSVVFDHNSKVAYACISERTNKGVFEELCEFLDYQPIVFNAVDKHGKAIYHTNVLMCIGTGFVSICMDAIVDNDKEHILNSFNKAGLEVIAINFEQLSHFVGNMLELKDNEDNPVIVLSQSAYDSLNTNQQQTLGKHGKLLPINVNTIETIAGGSVRCMIAEIFS